MIANSIDIDLLKKFIPFRQLSDAQLILLNTKVEKHSYNPKHVITTFGSSDNTDYFLLSGKLLLTASDGRQSIVNADSVAAQHAIATLRPRRYKVTVLEKSDLIQIDSTILSNFITQAPKAGSEHDGELVEFNNPIDLILDNFHQDLANNTLSLPSLPTSALRINELINWEDCSAKDVARVINQDPSMAVKLITAANSPLFRGLTFITTCEDAIGRLGFITTQRLLKIYTLRELFTSKNKLITKKMQSLWDHCSEVGAIAFVLARKIKGMSADQAMLAGLIHDIGAIPLLTYIESQSFLFTDPTIIDEAVNTLKAGVGKQLLEKWNWSSELISVAADAENWHYDHTDDKPNYTDIVIISQLHAAIGKKTNNYHPYLHDVPSFNKMGELELTPDKSICIIHDAQAEIEEVHRLLQLFA